MNKKSKKKVSQQKKELDFEVNDIVVAKVKGYPFWPGYVERIETKPKRRIHVKFYGSDDTSHALVEIKHYKDLTDKEKTSERKSLKNALIIAAEAYKTFLDKKNNNVTCNKNEDEEDRGGLKEEEQIKQKPPIEDEEDDEDDKEEDEENEIVENVEKEQVKVEQNIVEEDGKKIYTIAKLRKKVEDKLKEKEICKTKKRVQKLSTKLAEKLVLFNRILEKFSLELKKLAKVQTISQQTKDLSRIEGRASSFKDVIPVLTKCIQLIRDPEVFDSCECRRNFEECHKFLKIIDELLRKFKEKEQSLPDTLKKTFRSCRVKLSKAKNVKQLATDGPQKLIDAMIEIKENDAKKQKIEVI